MTSHRSSPRPHLPHLAWIVSALVLISLLGVPATSAPPALTLHSPAPGALHLTWPAVTPAPPEYHVRYAPADTPLLIEQATSATNTLTLYDLEPGVVYTVQVRAGTGPWSVPVVQRIDDYRADPETVGTIGVGAEETGYIESAGDTDWFFVDLTAGEGYPIAVTGATAPPLAVYDATGAVVQQGVVWHHASALTFTPATAGLYHLAVGGPEATPGRYTLTVAEPPTAEPRRPRTLAGATPTDTPAPRNSTAVPAKPGRPSATVTPGFVTLTWDAPNDASITGYVILRRDKAIHPQGTFVPVAPDTGTAATTYTDASVEPAKQYVYRTQARNAHGESERSSWVRGYTPAVPAPAPAVPAKPRGLTTVPSHDTVTLSWDAPNDASITGYVILRRDKTLQPRGTFFTVAPNTGTVATTYTDATVEPEKQYVYRIKAINIHGVSALSSWARGYTPAAPEQATPAEPQETFVEGDDENNQQDESGEPQEAEEEQATERPAKPTGLSAEATHDTVVLTWDNPNDDTITGYMILRRNRKTSASGEFRELASDTGTAATIYTDDTVVAGTTYTYRIKAINAAGPSERSRWFHIDTPAAPGATPVASERTSEYIDAHNAGVHDLDEFRPRSDSEDPDGAAGEEDDHAGGEDPQVGKQGKSVGAPQGKNIGPRATVNICNRTPEVRDALLESIAGGVTCSTVTDAQLADVNRLEVDGYSSASIAPSDFAGLTRLSTLQIGNSEQLASVPARAFAGLDSLTTLNLRNNRLTALHPDAFNVLPALTRLYLTNNALTWLPTYVFHGLSNLLRLDLNENGLSSLQQGTFNGLAKLETLRLTQNDLTSLEPGTFDGLSSLQSLSLQYNQLSSLDSDIFLGLSSLIWLGLEHNQLSALPEGVFDGLPLTRLFLNDNQLTWLRSDTFRDLSQLRTLWLDNNDLGSLDSAIFEYLGELSTLALVNIGLSSLPEDIFEHNPKLSWLYLFDNQLSSLPADVFDGLTALSRLRLDNNRLNSLPADVFDGLTSLERLYLEKNRLPSLPEDIFEDLDALESLWLDTNRLTTLPADVFDGLGDTLIELTLSDNDFDSLPADVFEGLSGLFYLLLHRSGLTELDSDLFDPLTSLWLLYLHGNGLTSLPEDIFDALAGLARLYLHDNDLSGLPVDVFDGVSGLQRLYLDGNELTTLDADVFDGLRSLQRLDLYSNRLSALPAAVFEDLGSSLGELHLQDNKIAALPDEIFDGLTGLRGLDLSCNALTALDLDVFDPFAGTLSYLDLDANSFTTPPTEAALRARLTALEALYLGGAPPCLPAFVTDLSALAISSGTLFPEFEPPGISVFSSYPPYRADVGNDDSLTVSPATENPNAVIGPSSNRNAEGNQFDGDLTTPGLQVALRDTKTEVWWQVTAENPAYTADYAVEVFRQHRGETDPRLGSLKLSGYTLTQAFRPDTYRYTAGRLESLPKTRVTAVALDPGASVEVEWGGRTEARKTSTAIAEITPVDGGVITVKVTSEDGTATRSYTVTLDDYLEAAADRSTHAVIELQPISRYESSVEDPFYQYEPLYNDDDDQIGVTQVDPVLVTRLSGRYEGEIDYPGDVDWVRLKLSRSHVYEVRVDRRASGTSGALTPRFETDGDSDSVLVHDDATDDAEIIDVENFNGHTFGGGDEFLLAAGSLSIVGDSDTVAVYVAVRGGDGKTLVCPSRRPCDVAEEGVVAYKPNIEVGAYTVRVRELDAPNSISATGCQTYRGVTQVGRSLNVSQEPDVVTSRRGRINWPTDHDCHAVRIQDASLDYRIRLLGSATDDGSLPDPQILGVYHDGTLLDDSSDDDGGYHRNSEVVINPTATGTYVIQVAARCLSRDDGELLASCHQNVGTYRLEVGPVD